MPSVKSLDHTGFIVGWEYSPGIFLILLSTKNLVIVVSHYAQKGFARVKWRYLSLAITFLLGEVTK